MIKVYCDRCGKEIIGKTFKVIEEVEAVDGLGHVLIKFPKEIHICDECQYNEMTCGFKVGDQVITDDGRVGIIESFCDCESCKKRGFYEPKIKMEIGNYQIWITDTDKKNGFMNFYKIGDQVFGNIDKESTLNDIKYKKDEIKSYQKELIRLKEQLNVVKKLK